MVQARERPSSLLGKTYRIRTGHGSLFVTVNWHEGRIFEVFLAIGKQGSNTAAATEAIGKLISLALRAGISVTEVIDQLQGIQCSEPLWHEGEWVSSVADAVAKVLRVALDETGSTGDDENPESKGPVGQGEGPVGGAPVSPGSLSASRELDMVGAGDSR